MTSYRASIIIPYFQAHQTINDCLETILSDGNHYQVILVDDASPKPFSKQKNNQIEVIRLKKNIGAGAARNVGLAHAKNPICLFIDADTVVQATDIKLSIERFESDNQAIAFTCQHHGQTPVNNFSSKYKALYMNYMLGQHKGEISFLYGAFCGLKKKSNTIWPENLRHGEDTLFATRLRNKNLKIKFYRDIKVTHLKNYSLLSLIKNDFLIPFHFTRSYFEKSYTGNFSHTNKQQLAAISCSPIPILWPWWFLFNLNFFKYLKERSRSFFMIKATLFTLADQFVMGLGIFLGLIYYGLTYNQLVRYKYPNLDY